MKLLFINMIVYIENPGESNSGYLNEYVNFTRLQDTRLM